MTLTAVLLLIVSAATHAGWNLLGKRKQPSIAFMLAANILGLLLMIPVLIIYWDALVFYSPVVWLYLVSTGVCQAVYFAGLTGAYRNGDLSIAYPLARSSPVVLVAVLTALLGLGKALSLQAVGGILLILAGSFVLPMRSFSDFRLKNYFNLTSLLALIAALGTTGYSIIDSQALQVLRQSAGQMGAGLAITLTYAFFEGVSTSVWMLFVVLALRAERQEWRHMDKAGLLRALLVGVGIYIGYLLVLFAMGFVTNVSYVVAFRQLSIPLGAILGMLVLKEPHPVPKFVGVATIFIGLVLVGLG